MKLLKATLLSTIAVTGFTANADVLDTVGNAGAVSAEIGTFGYGANVAWAADESTDFVLGYTGGDLVDLAGNDAEFEVEGVDYVAETDFSTPYLGLQLRPMKNWLTVGTGVMFIGNNTINATAEPTKDVNFTYQGKDYTAKANESNIAAEVSFENPIAPYLTLGFHPTINNRFGLFAEIGAAYTGGLDTEVEADGSFTFQGQTQDLTTEQTDELESRARQEIEESISKNDEWYPVLKAGITYRF